MNVCIRPSLYSVRTTYVSSGIQQKAIIDINTTSSANKAKGCFISGSIVIITDCQKNPRQNFETNYPERHFDRHYFLAFLNKL